MDDGTPAPFGDLLRQYRRAARLTQEALAERAGLAARGIQDLERGVRFPYRDTLLRLIAALGLSGADRERLTEAARPRRASRVGLATVQRDRAATRLPVPLTSLIGRDREAAEVQRLLRGARLVTLTGPGGVGKTRLALRVAASVQDSFEGGAVFVEIAAVTEAEAVLPLVVQALGIRETSGQAPLDVLEDYLRNKSILLVLDNFEHVLPASADDGIAAKDDELARRVADVLEHCPRLRVLVTSREALRVQGEQEYLVPPLRLPEPDSLPTMERLAEYEAIRLFVERARAARYDFPVDETTGRAIAEICRHLDGLPLAIELAAARAKLLPPSAMLARLERKLPLLTGGPRDAPIRHQTLRATIAWSYDLLNPAQQELFRRLGVFSGGWTLEAAEAVCGILEDGPTVLDGLAALLDKSLIREEEAPGGDVRFSMLETIREYALEQLEALGSTGAFRDRHLGWYAAFAEHAEPELSGPRQVEWLNRLATEHDNLRAALDWSTTSGAAIEQGLRMGGALLTFWTRRGYFREGRQRLSALLTLSSNMSAVPRARVLNAAGFLEMELGDYTVARMHLEEALLLGRAPGGERCLAVSLAHLGELESRQGSDETAGELLNQSLRLSQRHGDEATICLALISIGNQALVRRGDLALAESSFRGGIASARKQGDRWTVAVLLQCLWDVAWAQGTWIDSRHLLDESLGICEELGDRRGIASTLRELGVVALERGDLAGAHAHFERSLRILSELGDKRRMVNPLYYLGLLAIDRGDPLEAQALFSKCLAIMGDLGERGTLANYLYGLGLAAIMQGDLERARGFFNEYLTSVLKSGDTRGHAYALEAFAILAAAGGKPLPALRLVGAASGLRETIGAKLAAHWSARLETRTRSARQALGIERSESAIAEGRAMSREEAIAEALIVGEDERGYALAPIGDAQLV